MTEERIVDAAAVPKETTLLFTVADRESGEEREAVLVDTDDGIRAWFNYCQHWRDVNLDTGDGGVIRDGELVCKRHGATFECDSGECTFGPCEGAVLDELAVRRADGGVFVDDDGYAFVRLGEAESNEDDEIHRSTESRIGF